MRNRCAVYDDRLFVVWLHKTKIIAFRDAELYPLYGVVEWKI